MATMRRIPDPSESQIVDGVTQYLQVRGWRPIRFQRTVVHGQFQTGEPGQADYGFIYYLKSAVCPTLCLFLWIEFKSKNDRRKCRCLQNQGTRKRCTVCDQKTWRDRERARGGIVWSGVNDVEWFIENYDKTFAFLHSGDTGRGQLSLLAGI